MRLLRVNSSASEPALRPGKIFLIGSRKPKRFDLISYRAILPNKGLTMMTHRLCGLPGDTVEMRDGVFRLNGKEADGQLALKHVWKMDARANEGIGYNKAQAYTIPPYSDTIYIPLAEKDVKERHIVCERYILPPGLRDEIIYLVFRNNWNRDQFGPVRVPAGRWFLLGDNRGEAIDSRYLGFADHNSFVGTVLWK